MKKILFISHDAFRAGAQILLLHFLEWIKAHQKETQVDVLLIEGGVLKPRFEELSHNLYDYSTFNKDANSKMGKIGQLLLPKRTESFLFKSLKKQNYDLIYANSVVSLAMGIRLKQLFNCKLLLHVHELQKVIQDRVLDFSNLKNHVNVFVAASEMVKANLVKNHEIPSKQIKVIYEFSKIDKLVLTPQQDKTVFTVGGSGNISFRKGFDLFLETAKYIKTIHPEYKIHFMWVGGGSEDGINAETEIEKLGLKDLVVLTGEQETPSNYFQLFDVFLLTSREDPFPLVCIEVGQMGKPIICFKDVTGTTEILRNGGGIIVPFLDVKAIGDTILKYYRDRKLLEQDSKRVKELFAKFTPENICPQLFKVTKNLLNKN